MKGLLAAITLFTRIPAWKAAELKPEDYRKAVVYWPLTGWITGSLAAAVIYSLSFILPLLPAIIVGLTARLLLTCALHEDGLADFCDGFGGGHDREKILAIMKDSHIGTYGVIALISLLLLEVSLLSSLPAKLAACAIFAADPFAKTCASQLINFLEYARPEGAKNKILYARMTTGGFGLNLTAGLLPMILLSYFVFWELLSLIFPVLVAVCLIRYMRKKIEGYTGDCCGATYLICETAMLLGIVIIFGLSCDSL